MQDQMIEAVTRPEWLETVADEAQPVVRTLLQSLGPVKDFLHGTWLGHALHPAVTDIPVGAWTATVALDAFELTTGSPVLATGADAALAIGLAGAAGAAVTGLADWSETDGRARKIGVAHALLNTGAVALMLGSLALRRANQRPAAQTLSFLGFAVANVSAWLGGHLVFGEQIGVDHTVGLQRPVGWVDAMADADLADEKPVRVDVRGTPVVLVRRNGHLFALVDRCAHLGGPLSEGTLCGNAIQCPWHGSTFALDDGRVLSGPSVYPQPPLQARVREGRIEVRNPEPSTS